jgi:hypothetical protein
MKRIVTFASNVRLNALLCSTVAVLLTACGGSTTDVINSQQAQTAAYTYNSAVSSAPETSAAPATNVDADTSTTPAVADQAGLSANPGGEMSGSGSASGSGSGEPGAAAGATEKTPAEPSR